MPANGPFLSVSLFILVCQNFHASLANEDASLPTFLLHRSATALSVQPGALDRPLFRSLNRWASLFCVARMTGDAPRFSLWFDLAPLPRTAHTVHYRAPRSSDRVGASSFEYIPSIESMRSGSGAMPRMYRRFAISTSQPPGSASAAERRRLQCVGSQDRRSGESKTAREV
ncbi:hypothetical protein B0H19DRAFT_1245316 [Mycena capillaripes]|nr:hypothetical protein B0H19DRAFT_1245316 [Mycena capillaripes]